MVTQTQIHRHIHRLTTITLNLRADFSKPGSLLNINATKMQIPHVEIPKIQTITAHCILTLSLLTAYLHYHC